MLDLSVEVLDCRLRDLMVLQDEVEAHAAVVEEIVQAQGATPWSGEGSASGFTQTYQGVLSEMQSSVVELRALIVQVREAFVQNAKQVAAIDADVRDRLTVLAARLDGPWAASTYGVPGALPEASGTAATVVPGAGSSAPTRTGA